METEAVKEETTTIDGVEYTQAEIVEAANALPYSWVLQNEIKNEVGMPITFENRPWQKAIYNDLSPNQAFFKPPQIGATVMNTLKSLWVAKTLGRQIIYTLPTQSDVQDMVGGSFNRIIAQNDILKSWTKDHDTVEQKSVGDSMIFYRGTFTSKQAMMIPSGLNIHDEVDASDAAVVTQYETRLQAQADGGWRWYFSHPSLAGHGVDVYWQKSDMKEWYITCSKCGAEQTMTWPNNIDMQTNEYICSHCKAPMSDEDRCGKGRWINKDGIAWEGEIAGDYEFSGWHVSQLMLWNKTAKNIVDAFNDPLKDKQYFYNYVLGLPHIDSEDRIHPKVVLRNCVDTINQQTDRTVIGVDTGLGLHITLMNKEGAFYYEHNTELTATKSPYDRLKYFLKRFPKSIIVLDQGGELMLTRQLQQEFPGRVFLCYYQKDKKSIEIVNWGEGEEYWKVKVDRNRMITLMVEQLRDVGRIVLNGTVEEWREFAQHFDSLYREELETKETKGKDDKTLYGSEYVWKRNGPDHFCHSLLYALVGMQKFGGGDAKVMGENPLTGVPVGTINEMPEADNQAVVVGSFAPEQFRDDNRVF
jgi:DNA-directed RNA polymerase subunit RPC12/RpoP